MSKFSIPSFGYTDPFYLSPSEADILPQPEEGREAPDP